MCKQASYHFVLIEDSKLDSLIGEKIIRGLGAVCRSIWVFSDPVEALAWMQHRDTDTTKTIVLLDIQMPFMTGFEFIERYEATVPIERQLNYVINVLSSSINEKDLVRAHSYKSVNMFLNKPLNKKIVWEVIESLNH